MTTVTISCEPRNKERVALALKAIGIPVVLGLVAGCASTASSSTTTARATDIERPQVASTAIPELPLGVAAARCTSPGTDTLASVIRVATHTGSEASGVVIAKNRILTAAHVVKDEPDVLVYVHDTYRDAMVVARDRDNDLALLMADTGGLEPIRISQRHLLAAEPVWTVGYPLALELTTNAGRYQQHVDGAIHSSAGTNAGASGGGLLHCEQGHYELAGMIRGYGAYWHAGQLRRIEDLSISVPADTISSFASSVGIAL